MVVLALVLSSRLLGPPSTYMSYDRFSYPLPVRRPRLRPRPLYSFACTRIPPPMDFLASSRSSSFRYRPSKEGFKVLGIISLPLLPASLSTPD